MMQKNVLTSFQAAELCSTSDSSVKRWIKSGKLKAYKTMGGHYRIIKNDLLSFLKDNGMPVFNEDYIVRKKILIVDDDDILREGLARYLKMTCAHFDIETAQNGFDAGILVSTFMPDLILLDLVMPKLDGFSVCRKIKDNPVFSSINIIVLTGYKNDEFSQRALDCGADLVLHKPIPNNVLLEKMKIYI